MHRPFLHAASDGAPARARRSDQTATPPSPTLGQASTGVPPPREIHPTAARVSTSPAHFPLGPCGSPGLPGVPSFDSSPAPDPASASAAPGATAADPPPPPSVHLPHSTRPSPHPKTAPASLVTFLRPIGPSLLAAPADSLRCSTDPPLDSRSLVRPDSDAARTPLVPIRNSSPPSPLR